MRFLNNGTSHYPGKPFPEVADAVHVELEACRAAEQEIKRLKDVMGESGVENANDQIANTVSSLPGLFNFLFESFFFVLGFEF